MRSIVFLIAALVLVYFAASYFFPRVQTRRTVAIQHAEERYSADIKAHPKNPEPYLQRARVYARRKEYAKAEADLRMAQSLSPSPTTKIEIYHVLNQMHAEQGDFVAARKDQEAIVALDPTDAVQLNNLAWLLATCPDAKARDGAQAVKLAKQACDATSWDESYIIDTLAAAYAEDGDFTSAVKYQKQAMDKAPGSQKDDYASRLKQYQAKKPFREDPRESLPSAYQGEEYVE